jgi:hypothetical protein
MLDGMVATISPEAQVFTTSLVVPRVTVPVLVPKPLPTTLTDMVV